jgi:HPt (histidine-containing phosphotransfer) domain-containing protein
MTRLLSAWKAKSIPIVQVGRCIFTLMTTPIVDPETAERLRQLASDVADPGEDVIGDLLTTFREDSEQRLAALAKDLSSGELLAGAEHAHALKGASATIGAARAAEALKSAELELRAGHNPTGLLESLRREIAQALPALESALRGSR